MTDELPPGWDSAPLAHLGDWLGGGTPSKAVRQYWENGTVHWVSPKDMKRLLIDSAQDQITVRAVKESATNLVPVNSVLMVTRSGILEHSFPVAVNTVPVAVNQDLKALTLRSGICPLYIAYFLKARAQDILGACSKDGTTVSSIDSDRLASYEVALAPTGEQARIVSKIDELFSEIEEGERALERVQKLVERYRQSVLKAAVTGELTRDWREENEGQLESGEALLARILKARREAWERAELGKMKAKGVTLANDKWKQKYKEPSPPDTADLPDLPEGWVWASMAQLAWASSYGTSEKCGYKKEGPAVLRIPNIRSGRFDFTDIKYAKSDLGLEAGDLVSSGDLLVVRTNGSDRIIGVGAVSLAEAPIPCYFASYLIRFRLAMASELASWVNFCWQSHIVREFVGERKATSAGQYNVSQSALMNLCLPIPPKAERGVIVDEVERVISKSENAGGSVLGQSTLAVALRQAVLKSAFSGALVPQDAGNEPAAVLLERISVKRGAAPAKPKRGPKTKSKEPA